MQKTAYELRISDWSSDVCSSDLGVELRRRQLEAVAPGVAVDHREVGVLVAVVEAEPEAEAVGQADLLLHRLGGMDRGRALVLDNVARHQVAAIGGGVEDAVGGASLDAAFQHRLQRLVAGVLAADAAVVATQHAGARDVAPVEPGSAPGRDSAG